VNTQQVSSIIRQALAISAIVMGALTSALSAIKLPTAVSVALAAAGALVIGIEHFVSDPSTGTTPPVSAVPVSAPVPPVPTVLAPAPALPNTGFVVDPSTGRAVPSPLIIPPMPPTIPPTNPPTISPTQQS
jgi:hypothetical protein